MAGNVTESIFSGNTLVIPLADVQHVQQEPLGLLVITKHTKWNFENHCWENGIFVPNNEKEAFLKAWCNYRHELEADTLANLEPE